MYEAKYFELGGCFYMFSRKNWFPCGNDFLRIIRLMIYELHLISGDSHERTIGVEETSGGSNFELCVSATKKV